MDRDTILKYSRIIRLENKIPADFVNLVEEYCKIKNHPEHTNTCISLLHNPHISDAIVYLILEYFENIYQVNFIEKITTVQTMLGKQENKQLISIY